MGERLVEYYNKAKSKGGLAAQIKLATITKMSASKARSELDSPENIKIFEDAMAQI